MATMLSWNVPPAFIYIVLLVKMGMDYTPDSLDFCEVFAGQAEISKAMRGATGTGIRLFLIFGFLGELCKCPCFLLSEANYVGVSMDYVYDHRTQDLLSAAGFLLLGIVSAWFLDVNNFLFWCFP